ncbi:hypothetical protein SAMN05428989_3896 [Pseudoxanthomonas sp. GM95]|uniref:hypothetical protein n=1 Tax=Pseudoxanthomonas sp. GM95 TaxID=1881043 RepID=UPI0008CB4BF3|nr:hypothetical protein [Pseudoxanthomonas sp. GM95]SEM45248.1 hypothetical protein SAMN05428989_3896 [Pseudoxanthomonas sp. GM95]
MELLPILIFWACAAWGLVSRRPVLLYMFFATMPLGAFAAIPPGMSGGMNFTPSPLVALLLTARVFSGQKEIASALVMGARPAGMLLLTLFWIVAGFATLLMPTLFAGTRIVPVRITGFMQTEPLMANMQNVSQFAYLSISIITVFCFARLLSSEQRRVQAVRGVWVGAAATAVTGLLDLAGTYVPLEPVLGLFRTAGYSLLTDAATVGGGKRIVGLMPEASSFGALCVLLLSLLYFLRGTLPVGRMRRWTPALLLVLLAMTWLSTSSSAYVGLGVLAVAAGAEWAWRAFGQAWNHRISRATRREFAMCVLLVVACIGGLLLMPSVQASIWQLIDASIFQKSTSSSYEERSMWTAVSWEALLTTHGLGVGVGGTRASNFLVALASNTGFLGAALYLVFVATTLARRGRADDPTGRAILRGLRWSYVPAFACAILAGTAADFGLANAFIYGLAYAAARANSSSLNRLAPDGREYSALVVPLHGR